MSSHCRVQRVRLIILVRLVIGRPTGVCIVRSKVHYQQMRVNETSMYVWCLLMCGQCANVFEENGTWPDWQILIAPFVGQITVFHNVTLRLNRGRQSCHVFYQQAHLSRSQVRN